MPSNLSAMNPRIHLGRLALVCAIGGTLAAIPLRAQLIHVPRPGETRRPVTVSGDVGLLLSDRRFDAVEGGYWYLGEAIVYRGAADVALRAGSFGVSVSLAKVPMQRVGVAGSDGEIQFRQLVATFRSPETESFHQLIELSGGWSQWANYSGTDVLSSAERAARSGVILAIGYGFAFPIGSRATFSLVQDAGTVIGSGKDLPPGASRVQRQYTTRIGLRWRVAGER